jgi:hypothetical protein
MTGLECVRSEVHRAGKGVGKENDAIFYTTCKPNRNKSLKKSPKYCRCAELTIAGWVNYLPY